MFLTVLGSSLALGAGLLAAAGYSEGTLVAARTAALTIGWLFLLATLIGIQGARRARPAELGTTVVVFFCGIAVLYLSYFQWSEPPELEVDMELIAAQPLAPIATFVSLPAVARIAVPAAVKEPPVPRMEVVDACSALGGLESLQCKRCGGKSGVAWLLCQERARLEYCEERSAGEALCPSAIPAATADYVAPG